MCTNCVIYKTKINKRANKFRERYRFCSFINKKKKECVSIKLHNLIKKESHITILTTRE